MDLIIKIPAGGLLTPSLELMAAFKWLPADFLLPVALLPTFATYSRCHLLPLLSTLLVSYSFCYLLLLLSTPLVSYSLCYLLPMLTIPSANYFPSSLFHLLSTPFATYFLCYLRLLSTPSVIHSLCYLLPCFYSLSYSPPHLYSLS